jgi:5-methylcytosine-specific restriction enzyme subunit McrC
MNLFEYKNKETLASSSSFFALEEFLDEVWCNREKSKGYYGDKSRGTGSQQFLEFLHKTKEIKSKKYVGVIHFNEERINLLPKIFFNSEKETVEEDKLCQIQNHILWWLSYCRKVKFPNYQTILGSSKSDFFEILIYIFSKYTKELLSNSVYQQFEEISEEVTFMRGRLNVSDYINNNLSTGKWHKLNCTYDSFVLDNKFNRIIKHVSNMLFKVTKNSDNKKQLREILFILDDVTTEVATSEQCANIKFNTMFSQFETVKDYCQLFLSNSISFNYKNDLKLFAFLLPMDDIFEDFIFGFIKKELGEDMDVRDKINNTYLDNDKNFKLIPDLLITTNKGEIIADTKYKIIDLKPGSEKKIVSSDLYQVLTYAIRFNVKVAVLFYPNTVVDDGPNNKTFEVNDELADNNTMITIKAYKLPIIDITVLPNQANQTNQTINELFKNAKDILRLTLIESLQS